MGESAATTRARDLGDLRIGPADFVVEVGGGHDPFWRSNVIFDKYPFDNVHRSQDLVHRAPVIIADAYRLPLPDGGCDLLFASHLIEHLPAPDRFLAEVQRCAERVYLEFPARNRELLFAWGMHEWFVEARGSHLVFYRNDIPQIFGSFFHAHYDLLLDAWMRQRHQHFNTHVVAASSALTWEFARESAFERLVRSSPSGRAKVDHAAPVRVDYTWGQLGGLLARKLVPTNLVNRARQVRGRLRRGKPRAVTPSLLARLACPACRQGGLRLTGETLACPSCGAWYGKRGGLFDLDLDLPVSAPAGGRETS
jgi:hypothetical protein